MEPFLDTEHALPAKETEVTRGDKTEKEANPAYGMWLARDQQLLCFLLTTLSREISTRVVNTTTSPTLWAAMQGMFISQMRARAVNTRIALANLQKGIMSIAEYFGKIRTLADEMAAAGKKLDEEDVVSYVLASLDSEYNSIVSEMCSRVEPVTVVELCSQLLSYETRIDLLH
jgi:hypothetical protein